MRAPVAILGFVLACVAAISGCGDDNGGGGTPRPTSKELTSFSFLVKKNPGLVADATATIVGENVAVMVPFDTDVTALIATYTATGVNVQVNGVTQLSDATKNDFTNPVTYHITAGDGSTKDYKVTVEVAKSSAKELTAFAFSKVANPTLPADITATINGTAIAATVPFGTDVTKLVASFTTSGSAITVGGTAQVSGTTANNFTAPVTYMVTAADGTTKDYVVTITVAPSTAKAITAFAFLSAKNASLPTDVTATINGTAIAATVPFGTNVTALVATFTTTGASVTVGSTAQVSGTTANDFTNAVTYKVTAADNSSTSYTVTVTAAANPAKELTAFAFLSAKNPGLPADITATINGTAIAATVPFGTNVTALVATFATTGVTVKVGTATQASGITANNFTSPVDYVVTAADGTTKTYTVTVKSALNPAKAITAFAFLSASNANLPADVTAAINGTAITATVPFGTNVTALVATFATTGATVKVGAATQTSGMTANDFSSPVPYVVTAADGTSQTYTVAVTVALNPAKDLTAFAFLSTKNPSLPADVTATITGTAIAATVPFGTNVTALVATFATTGASVKVGAATQDSGITANNFSSPVPYVVTAADGTSQTYTVTVTIAPSSANDLTAFAFLSAKNPGLPTDVVATINGTAITATVPFGTDLTKLIATFATTGASVKVGTVVQDSGITENNFASPVQYEVAAAGGATKTYTVTVSREDGTAKALTAFAFLKANNPTLPADAIAAIDEATKAITVTVPFSIDLTGLVATFATTGVGVKVGATAQVSGVTANDFNNVVTYTVTSADGRATDYKVQVALGAAPKLSAFGFLKANNPSLAADYGAVAENNGLTVHLPQDTDVTQLVASFATLEPATITVNGVEQTTDVTANDFTAPVTYRVTATDGGTIDYLIAVKTDLPNAKDLTSFSFTGAKNPTLFLFEMKGTITGTNVVVEVPFGINAGALIATFTTTGTKVTVDGVTQTSGTTANNFSSAVTYVVTAADSSTKSYTVTLVPLVTSFAFTNSVGNEATFNADTNNTTLGALPVMSRMPASGATNAAGAFGGNGWNTTAINLNHYFTFTVKAGTGRTLNLTKLQLRVQRSGSGPVSFAVRSSLNNFATDLATGTTPESFANNEIALTGFTGQAQVEFRFYAYGTTNSGGTFRIDDVQLSGTAPQTLE